MKIRKGFVSNSSSSSFCILGIVIEESDEPDDGIDSKINKPLCYSYGIENFYDSLVIGGTPQEIGEDETMGDFRKRIAIALTDAGFKTKPEELSWCLDGGHGG